MRDFGLMTGVKALWEEDLLWDYTVKVEGREFQAHKVVLASVSKYFKAMLSKTFVESKVDQVELKGLNADTIAKLLEFIYTAEEQNITDNMLDVLRCAVYLQMPLVTEFCVEKLMQDLDAKNCLEALSALKEYSFIEEIEKVKKFIISNWKTVVQCTKPAELSHDILQVLLDNWENSEWEMFLFIKDWYSGDPENREEFLNDFFSQVRFCLMGQKEVTTITEMDIFSYSKGPWHELVEKAMKYHQLPINLKVLEKTEQSAVRTEPAPLFFASDKNEDASTFFMLDEEQEWIKYANMAQEAPDVSATLRTVGIEVNNFFVMSTGGVEKQEWHIFDPRMLTWSRIANMPRPKQHFTVVHHGYHIYTVGGKYLPDKPTREIERYNFLTNSWSLFVKLPVIRALPKACVLGDIMYVTGGFVRPGDEASSESPDQMYSRDLSSPNCKWRRKRSPSEWSGIMAMFVLKMKGEEGLIIIDCMLEMQYYSPSRNCWEAIRNNVRPDIRDMEWSKYSLFLARGNSLFILRVEKPEEDDDEEQAAAGDVEYRNICLNWRIPENGPISEVTVEDFPVPTVKLNSYGAMLSIAPQIWF